MGDPLLPRRGLAERVVRASRLQLGAGIMVGAAVISVATLPFLPVHEAPPASSGPDPKGATADVAPVPDRTRGGPSASSTTPPAATAPWVTPGPPSAPAVSPKADIPVFVPAMPGADPITATALGGDTAPGEAWTAGIPRGTPTTTEPRHGQDGTSGDRGSAAMAPQDAPRDSTAPTSRSWDPPEAVALAPAVPSLLTPGGAPAGMPDASQAGPTTWTSVPQPTLRDKAEALLAKGEVASARLWLTTAADRGDAEALFRLAETYDPVMLGEWRVVGLPSDRVRARDLYAKALSGGIEAARERVARLGPDPAETGAPRSRTPPGGTPGGQLAR